MNFQPITIILPHHDWNYIVGVLRNQPMAEVENLVTEMRRQVAEQTNPKEENDGGPANHPAA